MKIRADKSAVKHIKIAAKDVKYGSTQLLSSSPTLSPTVTFRLKLTPELEKIAEKVDKTADGTQEYVFFVGINSYTKSRTDNCLTLVVYQEDGDESVYYIELKDGAKEALYERLDEQCRKKLGKSCEKLLKEAKKMIGGGSQTPLTFIWGPLYLFFTIPSDLSPGSSMLYNHRSR